MLSKDTRTKAKFAIDFRIRDTSTLDVTTGVLKEA